MNKYFNIFLDTQQAEYHLVASVTYRANGAVASACLGQYQDLMAQYYQTMNGILSQQCSAINVNMNVSFINTIPMLTEENVVKVNSYNFAVIFSFLFTIPGYLYHIIIISDTAVTTSFLFLGNSIIFKLLKLYLFVFRWILCLPFYP